MLYPVQIIFDLLFPPTKHERLLRQVTAVRFSTWYRPNTKDGIDYLTNYHLPEVMSAIAACKFEHNYHAAKLLSTLVHTHLAKLPPKSTLLIPVPLSSKRHRKRLFNQVERVLKYTPRVPYPTKLSTGLLIRVANTKPQTSLTRKERLTNLQNAFAVTERNLFQLEKIERIIICDDVLTTGATLKAAKNELTKHVSKEVEVICLAWAH